ncbi:MAG: phosphoribosyl-ATP diphosphatase [Pigmentiphaga sp.]
MTDSKPGQPDVLARVADTIAARRPDRGGDPAASYVAKLFSRGPDAFLKKIGEEATEVVLAAKNGDPEQILYETADLWFHCLVALEHYGLRPEQVLAELARREGLSGLAEKAARPSSTA